MPTSVHVSALRGRPPWINSWALLALGLTATLLSDLPAWTRGSSPVPALRLPLLAAGLLAAAAGVMLRPRSAGGLALAALVSLAAAAGVDPDWDTLRLVLGVLTGVAGVAAVLVLVPREVGRTVVSLLILIHFGGILTAVTSVPPPGAPAPWLVNQLWTRFYRPYLQFMYLNNAYHFYSPEPGPATLLWFRVQYADGSARWALVPNRAEHARDPLALEYYRRLPIAESTNQLVPAPRLPPEVARRRQVAGELDGIPSPEEIAAYLPGVPQFRPPVDNVVRLLPSYAAFIARRYPHRDPAVETTGVKVYRVVHGIVPPAEFAAGRDPLDPTLYLPYFQGEYDRDGRLKDPSDPYLYWLIPIVRVAGAGPAVEVGSYVGLHAGSSPWEEER